MASIVRRQPKGCPEPVYYYHETYRVKVNPSDKGKKPGSGKSKVRSRDIYLGTAKQVLAKIQNGQRPQEVDKREFGLACAALSVAEEIGLVDVIDKHVPKRRQGLTVGQYLLVGILNKIVSPTSRNGIRDWFKKTVLPERLGIDPDLLSSQNFWDHFDLIVSEKDVQEKKNRLAEGEIKEDELFEDDVICRIEEGIWENVLKKYDVLLDTVLYDATNFFTFLSASNDSFLARTGHNKHGRHNLRQVGLALGVTRDAALPLLHTLYHGRKHDAKLFPEAMTDLVNRYLDLTNGSKKLTVVFDKGNNSADNIKHALEHKLHVVGSLVPSHHPDLTGIKLKRYDELANGHPVYRTQKEVFGIDAAVCIIYNEKTYRKKKKRLREKVEQLRTEVRTVFEQNRSKNKGEIEEAIEKVLYGNEYRRYLEVKVEGRRYKRLVCHINRKNYYDKLRTLGKTIIFTDDLSMSTKKMVELYLDKYKVEDQFRQMNDPEAVAFRPMYHWTDSKIRVYALICVLALLILQLMKYRAKQAGLDMSSAVLRSELSDIVEVVIIYSLAQVERRLTVMSTVQQRLFEVFDLSRWAPS